MMRKDGDKNMEERKYDHFNSTTEESSVLLPLKASLSFAFLTKTLLFYHLVSYRLSRKPREDGEYNLSEHMLCNRYHCRHQDGVEDKTKFLPSNFHPRKEE